MPVLPPLPSQQPIAANALRNKRSEIAGLITFKQREIDRLRADLVHVDAVLRIFDPKLDPNEIPAKGAFPKRSGYFERGELTRRIFDALRLRGDVASGELTADALLDKGIPRGDRATRRDFAHRFIMALHQLRRQGSIEKLGAGQGVRWKLAPKEPGLI
jgi:hypothetical protein